MIIDLETYRPRVSETPQIAFRRTEADRRPARVVARPNDYAPTWEQRQAESARRLQAITAKRVDYSPIEKSPQITLEIKKSVEVERQAELYRKRAARLKIAVLRALADGAETSSDICRRGICSVRLAHKAATTLRLAGLVSATSTKGTWKKGGIPPVTFQLTPAGREAIRTGEVPE